MLRYALAVFDFDGTLVDSEACIRASLAAAFERHGLTAGAMRKEWIGLPLHTIIRSACDDVDERRIESIIEAYRAHYAEIDPRVTFAFPGMVETLHELARTGVRLAVATNKHSRPARGTLERLGIAGLFDPIIGAEQVTNPKPHPDLLLRVLADTGVSPACALMIGDADVDLHMAAAAGVASCAVTWGNHSLAQLRAAGPAHIAQTPCELRALLSAAFLPGT